MIPPARYEPDADLVARVGASGVGTASVVHDPIEGVSGADVVYADVWASMGQESEASERLKAFDGYQITSRLLDLAADNVCFLHCLPAHEGEEIAKGLFADPRTATVWAQAGNRLHAQKALLEHLITG